ncbi:MAG: DUF58 domain-containing protein [Planctomycetaceae bacterium]|jgi:uncharacterized protein (DUF58 family)|nr:DUF58 domain-containing protein [Planctomycetaceae bacterium]
MSSGYRYLEPEALARMKNLSMVARGVVEGSISGLHSSPYKGFSVEFAEHREYTAGDDPRHLDYKMLARTDRLYIKQYEEETNMRVQILLDTSASMGYRQESKITKLQYGSYLTAILAYLMTRQQDSVGLTTFDTQIGLDMPARSSPRHFNEMMQRLEAVEPGEETDIASILHLLANRFKKRCLIVVISDLYDEPDDVMRALHHFRHRKHEVIVFNVFDKAEVEFPFTDTIAFHDLETNEKIQIDPAYVRDAYREQINEFIEGYRRSCTESNIDYVMTDTSVPYDFMLSKYIAKRTLL